MNTLVEELFQLHGHYPGTSTLIASLLKALAVLSCAWILSALLRCSSARARSWVWRMAMIALGLLALWPLRPDEWSGIKIPVSVALPPAAYPPAEVHTTPVPNPAALTLSKPSTLSIAIWDGKVLPVWLVIALLLVVWRSAKSCLALIWLRRGSEAAPQEIAKRCPVGLKVRITTKVNSPLLTGTLHPTIWLPPEANCWGQTKLESAISHEHAHHLRRDPAWQGLAGVVTCLWWWLPPVRWAFAQLKREAERAADDHVIGKSLPATDYAMALIEIANQSVLNPVRQTVGTAMTNSSELESRIKGILTTSASRNRVGSVGGAGLSLMTVVTLCLVIVSCEKAVPVYESTAKLVAGGRVVRDSTSLKNYRDYLSDFYGTIIETLESNEMGRRTTERTQALHPEFKRSEVKIRVIQTKGSAVFDVIATGTDPIYTREYLNSLLDEYLILREQERELKKDKALMALNADIQKKAAAEQDSGKMTEFKKAHNMDEVQASHEVLSSSLK